MIIAFVTSFWSEYELYKTESPRECINDLKQAYYNGASIDTNKYILVGCQDDFSASVAQKICDEVVWIDDILG